jgi:hypothetical protein
MNPSNYQVLLCCYDMDFFERTTHDSACFIDIEEKNRRP